ncbi:DUF763 domain-containing protein [Candidatus Parcubacteria bacterium]|nr:MAG: DUF763 domain-containing protein [Candidatus Parcubacteria bacterium]
MVEVSFSGDGWDAFAAVRAVASWSDMLKRGIATFTLDTGKCPKWLFARMVRLGREVVELLIEEFGPDEFVRRMGDPVWFQSLGTLLAFDWNASGLTTTLTAALKEAIRGRERALGIAICGGKGKTSRKTPEEILRYGFLLPLPDRAVPSLQYSSRMAAKVDSALVQDGFAIYHHAFFFSASGAWSVVQQGMNPSLGMARRYHWHSAVLEDFVRRPHAAIHAECLLGSALNLVAEESARTRDLSVKMVQEGSARSILRDLQLLDRFASRQLCLVRAARPGGEELAALELSRRDFSWHPVVNEQFSESRYLKNILAKVVEECPASYEELVAMKGVGATTIRALALVAEVIYGAAPSYRDPARYSFAFGGKDGVPFPVSRERYDEVLAILQRVVERLRIDRSEKRSAAARLRQLPRSLQPPLPSPRGER